MIYCSDYRQGTVHGPKKKVVLCIPWNIIYSKVVYNMENARAEPTVSSGQISDNGTRKEMFN